jgi:hypothetical protein
MTLTMEASNVHIDGPNVPKAEFEILLRFVCDFALSIDGVEVFREAEFPFMEFASQLVTWQRASRRRDFDYESMESDVCSSIYFHRAEDGAWEVGSALPGHSPAKPVTEETLRNAVKTFLAWVPTAVRPYGIDADRFLQRFVEEVN